MTHEEYLQSLRDAHERIRKDPVKLKKFLREVMGPPTKTLTGNEKEKVMLLLTMAEPYKQTNNQQSWTDYYNIGGKEYHATYFPDDKDSPILDEILEDDE